MASSNGRAMAAPPAPRSTVLRSSVSFDMGISSICQPVAESRRRHVVEEQLLEAKPALLEFSHRRFDQRLFGRLQLPPAGEPQNVPDHVRPQGLALRVSEKRAQTS